MDNQADTILNSGGFTTNKPNCATQLAGRNYAHPWTSSIHAHRCIRATSPQIHVCRGRQHPPLHIPRRTDASLSGKNNCRASIPRRCFLELQRTLTAPEPACKNSVANDKYLCIKWMGRMRKAWVRAWNGGCIYGRLLFHRLIKGGASLRPCAENANLHRWKRRWHCATFAARGHLSWSRLFRLPNSP